MSPRCTVLLPVHNGMPYLPEALESILHQTERDLLVIVLDDGSTDGTKEYLAAVMDTRVTVVTMEHSGLPAVLNLGLKLVTTKYTARMDSDDISVIDRISRQCDFLDRNTSCIIVGSSIRYIGERGNKLFWKTAVPTDDESIKNGLQKRQSVIFHPSIVCRTEVLKRCGGYRPDAFPAEDYDLYLRLMKEGTMANIPDELVLYRVTGGSIIGGNFIRSLRSYQSRIELYTGKKNSRLERLVFAADETSLLIYRKGLQEYLNGSKMRSYGHFFLSACLNPFRLLRFMKRLVR